MFNKYRNLEAPSHKRLSKQEILKILLIKVCKQGKGDRFTLKEIFGEEWELLHIGRRRQVCKEFKIAVCRREINAVYFLPDKDQNNNYIYVRR